MLEDSDNGIKSGKTAGANVCAITTSHSAKDLYSFGADIVIDRFDELDILCFPK